jgi:hypothetical protein
VAKEENKDSIQVRSEGPSDRVIRCMLGLLGVGITAIGIGHYYNDNADNPVWLWFIPSGSVLIVWMLVWELIDMRKRPAKLRQLALQTLEGKLRLSKQQYLQIFPGACKKCCSRTYQEKSQGNSFNDYDGGYTSGTITRRCTGCGKKTCETFGYFNSEGSGGGGSFEHNYGVFQTDSPYLTEQQNRRFPSFADCLKG